MAYTIKQARPILLGYLGLTEVNADYIPNTDNWGIRFTKNGLDCVIFVMPLGENTSSPKIYFDVRDSGAEKFVAAWEYAETHNLKFFCLGVKDINDTYKDSVISIEADIKTVLNVSGLENGRRSGSGTQLNIPKSLVPNGNVNRKKSDRFNIFYAVIDKNFILNYLESFDNRLFQFIAEPAHLDDNTEPTDIAGVSRNRIVFGAPGTGKSFILKTQSSLFEDQKKISKDKKDEIRNAIAEAITKSGKLTLLNSIGFKYSEELKSIQRKDLSSYCEYDKIDELYIGSNAKPISDEIQIEKDEQLTDIDFIKDLIQNKKGGNDSLKWANAIGFKFGDFLKDWTLDELRKTFELSEPQMWWIYRGAQASQIRSSEIETEIKYVERVTFHPNYSYAQFVGTYKPVQDSDDKKQIKYEYVPGPFMRMYCAAKKNSNNDFLLIIEEINRANVAAVFGDVFQLLDRKNGVSEYPIAASEDIRNFLADNGINEKELCIPSNMYIWATMNSADQGVFPMDTAFKRRWEFEYIGIDDNAEKVANYEILIGRQGDKAKWKVKWDELRRSINDKLISLGINEDKLLGPYFLSESVLESAMDKGIDFVKSFESKVLMYLFEDAAKMKVRQLFKITSEKYIYSEVCKEFEEKGVEVFALEKYPNVVDIASSES